MEDEENVDSKQVYGQRRQAVGEEMAALLELLGGVRR
jgi:hypothetical protein